MGPVLLCARLGGMAVSAHRTQTRSVSAYRRPECLLKSRMCERHLSGSERAWAATFGEHPVYSTTALVGRSLLRLARPPIARRVLKISRRAAASCRKTRRKQACALQSRRLAHHCALATTDHIRSSNSKHITQRAEYPAVAAVGPPLVEEAVTVRRSIRNAEVSGIRKIEDISAKLQLVILRDSHALENAEVHLSDAIAAENVAPRVAHTGGRKACIGISHARTRGKRSEQCVAGWGNRPANSIEFFDGHSGQVEARRDIRSNGVADQPRDSLQCQRRVPSVQRREGRSSLESQERSD